MARGRVDLTDINKLLSKAELQDIVLRLPSRAKGLSMRVNLSRKKCLLADRAAKGESLTSDEAEFLDLIQKLSISLTPNGVLTIGKVKRPAWGLADVCMRFGVDKTMTEAEVSQAKFLASLESGEEKLLRDEGKNPYL